MPSFANPRSALPILADVPLDSDPLLVATLQEWKQTLEQFFQTLDLPPIVTGFTAVANATTIVLTWNSARNTDLYKVYRNTTGDFSTATVIQTVGASKTGIASLSTQDAQDQTQAQRFYWVQGVNTRGFPGPQSQMVTVTNFSAVDNGSTAIGKNSSSTGLYSTVVGDAASDGGFNGGVAIGYKATNTQANQAVFGSNESIITDFLIVAGNSVETVRLHVSAPSNFRIEVNPLAAFGIFAGSYSLIADDKGNLVVGAVSVAFDATDGFPEMTTMNDAPGATPTVVSGAAPFVFDTTHNKLWIYNETLALWKFIQAT